LPCEVWLSEDAVEDGKELDKVQEKKLLWWRDRLARDEQKSVFASYLIRFKLNPNKIIPKFFFYYGLSPFYKNFIEETLRVVAQPNINAKRYSKLKIQFPPLMEQKRIVAYIDKIRETMESLKKLQQKTEEELEKLAPAILDRAFRGNL
jgi:type I restriction enzyme S subunit